LLATFVFIHTGDAEAPTHVIPAARCHWSAAGSQSQRRGESRDPAVMPEAAPPLWSMFMVEP